MSKTLSIYMSLILVMEFSDVGRPMEENLSDAYASPRVGMDCSKKIKNPLTCMTCQIYFESRGEPERGQLAVAKVTLKRANSNSAYVCNKVFERKRKNCQFSWTCDGNSHVMRNPAAVKKAVRIAQQAFEEGPDNFDHFYATYINQPIWAKQMSCKRIGKHIFCNGTHVAGYKMVPSPTRTLATHEFVGL